MFHSTIQANTVQSGATTYKLFVHSPSIDEYVSSPAWNDGNSPGTPFEQQYQEVYKKLIDLLGAHHHKESTDALVLDIGANIGTHAMWFASQNYELHAFEPSQENMEMVRCSAHWNNFNESHKLFLNNIGLAEVPMRGNACMSKDSNNKSGLYVTHDCSDNAPIYAELLDDYWMTVLKKRRVDFMEIDVEGFEDRVFQGATEMLRQAPPSIVHTEFYAQVVKNAGSNPEEYLNRIKSFGYTIYKFQEELVPPELNFESGTFDLLLWHKDIPVPPNNKL